MRPLWRRESNSIPKSDPSTQKEEAPPPNTVKMRPWWRRKLNSIPTEEAPPPNRVKMRPWWLRRLNSFPKSNSSAKKEEALAPPKNLERARSFDGLRLLSPRKSGDIHSLGRGSCGRLEELSRGHPLPLPTADEHGAVSACVSAFTSSSVSASVSSSGSSDDTSFLPHDRSSDTATPRRRNVSFSLQRNLYASEFSTVMEHPKDYESSPLEEIMGLSAEAVTGPRTTSSSPNQWPDIFKSTAHPLPLPPGSPSSPPLSSCAFMSQWKRGKLIGQGTFGHVYVGFNSKTGQTCAIKEVKNISGDLNSKECLKQLNQEITTLSKLSHCNIVQYYGSELCDDTLSVYLEYVSGGSIHKLLQEYGPFSEPVIRNFTAKILSGLAYLHEKNTIHRDIKGANILVGSDGEIKLADFGMAKLTGNSNSIRSFKGSPYWMAPEVIMNDNGYSFPVDIWSLGCAVLEMASSKPPWSQYEGVAAIFKIANSIDLPEIPDHLSHEGKDFIRLCLQRNPSVRQSAFQLINHPFVREQTLINTGKSVMRSPRATTATQLPSTGNSSPLCESEYGMRRTSAYTTSGSICERPN